MKLTLKQATLSPKNQEERQQKNHLEQTAQKVFNSRFVADLAEGVELPVITPITTLYPISQKHSQYKDMPYGEIGTIGGAGCGPLVIQYSLKIMGFSVAFEDIVNECVAKGYRGYEFDKAGNIIGGAGTENDVFDIAQELQNLDDIISALKNDYLVTVLIANEIYHADQSRKGNHFISLIGIDGEKNAIFMDGNMITDPDKPEAALVRKNFRNVALGFKGAWAWAPKKIMESLN